MPGSPYTLRGQRFFRGREGAIAVHREPRQMSMPNEHRHDFLEIALVLSGQGVHVTRGSRQRIRPGHLLVIHHDRPHGYEETESLNLVNILVGEEILPRIERDLRELPGYHQLFGPQAHRRAHYASYLRLNEQQLGQMIEWTDRLDEESRRTGRGGRLVAEAYLTLIITLVCRLYGKQQPNADRGVQAPIGAVLSWIEGHLAEPISVSDLARRAGMSERTFYRAFRQTTGRTPTQYLRETRLRRAAELLRNTQLDLTLSQIAEQTGFSDPNYLTRCFTRHYGRSPRRWMAG